MKFLCDTQIICYGKQVDCKRNHFLLDQNFKCLGRRLGWNVKNRFRRIRKCTAMDLTIISFFILLEMMIFNN